MIYLGEWLTLAQAANALGIKRAELRPLHDAGDIVTEQIRPGVWRVQNQSVQDLLATPEWKDRSKK
jgi:predicted site-specific integrase-resolvase